MKEGMSQLEKIQSDLAEFFCEDTGSFKIDECFKSFAGFNSKLKQVLLPKNPKILKFYPSA